MNHLLECTCRLRQWSQCKHTWQISEIRASLLPCQWHGVHLTLFVACSSFLTWHHYNIYTYHHTHTHIYIYIQYNKKKYIYAYNIIQLYIWHSSFTMVKNHPTCASQMKESKNLKVPHPMKKNTPSPPHLCTGAILLIIGATSNDVNAIPHRSGRHITSLHWHGCFGHPLMGVGCIINHKPLTCHTGNASSCEQCLVSHGDGSDVKYLSPDQVFELKKLQKTCKNVHQKYLPARSMISIGKFLEYWSCNGSSPSCPWTMAEVRAFLLDAILAVGRHTRHQLSCGLKNLWVYQSCLPSLSKKPCPKGSITKASIIQYPLQVELAKLNKA